MAKRYQDKYYTPANIVKAVLKVIEKDIGPLEKFERIVEPSAGAGAFLKQLPEKFVCIDYYLNGFGSLALWQFVLFLFVHVERFLLVIQWVLGQLAVR